MKGRMLISRARQSLLIFALAVGGLGLGACGGGDDEAPTTVASGQDTTSSAAAMPLQDYLAEADGVCAEANAAIANLAGPDGDVADASAVREELQITQGVQSSLEAIGEPEDPDGSVRDFMTALRQQIRALSAQEQALTSGDAVAADSAAAELESARSTAASAAEDAGFEDCGGEGVTLPSEPASGGSTSGEDPTGSEPTEPAAPAPTEPATPAEPATPPPSSGGTGTDPGGGTGSGGGGGSSSSGGIGPG